MPNSINLVAYEPNFEARYRQFLGSQEDGLLYYTLEYKQLLEALFPKARSTYWLAIKQEQIVGVLPLFETDTPLGTIINSLPFFGSYGGVLASDQDAEKALIEKYRSLSSASEVASSTLITNPFETSELAYPQTHCVSRICQITPLDKINDEDSLFQSIDSSTRRNIRKAQKSDLEITVDPGAALEVQKIHEANMNDIGGTPKPSPFFSLVGECFKPDQDYRLYVAKRDGQVIAGLLLFYCNSTVEYFTPATHSEFRQLQPSAQLIATAMLDACKMGYKYWNWGGTWDSQDGVYRFKKKWGAVDYKYTYHVQINNSELLNLTRAQVIELAPFFYVLPYNLLENE